MKDAVGPGEAARRLGVSTRTVQRWLREGRLPSVQVGSHVKVDASALPPDVSAVAVTPRPIERLLVANRGELVVRIARTCRQMGIRSLALVTEDQSRAWWIGAADAIVPLRSTYLDAGRRPRRGHYGRAQTPSIRATASWPRTRPSPRP